MGKVVDYKELSFIHNVLLLEMKTGNKYDKNINSC